MLILRAGGTSYVAMPHAASHEAGGDDALVLAQSQIINLTTDLTGKQPSDADLSAIAALTGLGWAKRTGDGTWVLATPSAADVGADAAGSAAAAQAAAIAASAPVAHVGSGGTAHADATTTVSGFLSAADKTKLDGIAAGAEVNVNADWNATSGDAQILNKPTTMTPTAHTHAVSELTQSGATTGQAPVWNGTAWVPADVAASVSLASDREVNAAEPPASSDSRLRLPWLVNYLANPDGEVDASGWAVYADAAGTVPVDGTGGSPVVALTRNTATPLRGAGSLNLFKGTGDRQGQGASTDFTIAAADCNRSLTIAGVCRVSSGYLAGDVTIHVLDTTTGTRCPISGDNAISASGAFSLQFSTNSNTAYRLCFHVASTNAAAWTLDLDDMVVGPTWVPSVFAGTDWQDGGAIVLRSTGAPPTKGTTSKDRIWWRRSGDSVQLYVEYVQSAIGSPGSGYYKISLPAGLTIDTSKVTTKAPGDKSADCGHDHIGTGSVGSDGSCGPAFVYAASSTELWVEACTINGSAAARPWGAQTYPVSSGGLRVSFFTMPIPIAGWSGSQAVQPGSRYLWAQRFAATAVRVTTTPSKPGEYRARRGTSDVAPTYPPSAANGLRLKSGSGLGANDVSWIDLYIGPQKTVAPIYHLNSGRNGQVDASFYVNVVYSGVHFNYDPTSGIASFRVEVANAGDKAGWDIVNRGSVTDVFCDLLVADDPVPVALAPTCHVEASSDAGQVVTANSTVMQYEDETVDTHSAWNGSRFTAPFPGIAFPALTNCWSTSGQDLPYVKKNGATLRLGNFQAGSGQRTNCCFGGIKMAQGDYLEFFNSISGTRDTSSANNWLSITLIGGG